MLTAEDALRLNVLLANRPLAVRIDEPRLTVHGLMPGGEAQLQLHPNCREESYLKQVREALSGHVLGSPGGYPVYLQRWTRMGQMRDESLEQLLVLGEPEAVVAAVCAPGLTDELARRAWWAMEDAENARRMLQRAPVAQGSMGPVLAAFLIEHLPFETEPEMMIESVRLALQPGLIDAAARDELWRKAARRQAYYVGFLLATPDDLPLAAPAHPLAAVTEAVLRPAGGDPAAALVGRALSPAGQAFLDTCRAVFDKPANQDVVNSALAAVARYFRALRPEDAPDATLEALQGEAEDFLRSLPPPLGRLLDAVPDARGLLESMRVLSGLGYGVVRPVFGDSTAIGSLMRRKLEPVFAPLRGHLDRLRAGRLPPAL
jgi:hypothetical protein